MTRDTYDVTIRRASQMSHKLELFPSPPAARRPSKVCTQMAKRSLLREDFRGSDRTLVSSGLDSSNSSRSNVHTLASSSYYTNSNLDIRDSDKMDDDDDDCDVNGVDEDDEDDDGREKPEELETDRGLWDQRWHYLLLGFGSVFGVRNILDFPALAMEHGGGAFLFTYVILTFAVGLPIVYLEVSLGQYTRGGVVNTWRILPLARGIGVSSLLLSLTRSSYSSTLATWSLYYVYSAIVGSLPRHNISSVEELITDPEYWNMTDNNNSSSNISAFYHLSAYSSCYNFFFNSTLEISDSISNTGHVLDHVMICLVLIWCLVFLLSAMGPRLMGKVSFCFTAIPSVLLVIMFVAACTMPGSVLGIQTFLNPRWHNLATVKPWLDCLDLVLSSLTCGTGLLITLSGHCNFHGNTFRSAIFMTSLSVVMTTVSGCLMFSLFGAESFLSGLRMDNMTHISNVEIGFVLVPAVTSDLPAPNMWSGIFFTAVVLLGLVQAAVMIHHIHQGILDLTGLEETKTQWKIAILGSVVVIVMSFNILTTAQNGLYVLRFLQLSVPRLTTPLLCIAQCVTVGWGYGARRFAGRVTEMTGRNKSFVWKWLWRWGCPVLLSLVSVTSLLTTNLLQDLPVQDMSKKWLHGIGWAINPAILLPGVVMAVASFFSVPGTFKQRLKQLRSTPSTWGPGHPEHEPQADLPDYVICHPDPFRPANALAMLTANLYLPNIVNFVKMESPAPETDMAPGYLSDVATLNSSDDDTSIDSPPPKESFLGRCHATITCLSHVIGLGNVVRFPYLAYRHGGGAFLIAYVLILVTCGLPLVILETAIGQFSSLGPISVWRAIPICKGIGYSMVVISLVQAIYYSVVTSWSVFYLATSLTSVMPWQDCTHAWNTNSCRSHDLTLDKCRDVNASTLENLTCIEKAGPRCAHVNLTMTTRCNNVTSAMSVHNNSVNPSDEYFYLAVVKISGSWNEVGELRWQLALCLLLTWSVVILFMVKSCKPGGKITYFILALTCGILVILLIRSSSLKGGHNGLSHLFTPQWSRLIQGHVWRDAASQVFFSLSLGSGTLVAMGTYNKFNNNIFREAVLLCVIDLAVSLLSSLVIFAVIGALAHATGRAIEVVARADLGLAFVTLSDATLHLPWPLFWAILAFLTLVLCGVFTCVAPMATAVTSVMDVFSGSLRKQRVWLLLSLCSGCAVLGLPMIVQVGFYVVDILDTYLSGLPQVCVGGAIVVAFAWLYGMSRLCTDIMRMTGQSVGWCWRLAWLVVCPCVTAMLTVSSMASLISAHDDFDHPWWATALGLVLWFLLITPIFVGIVHEVSQYRTGGLMEKLRKACQSKKEWGATLHSRTSRVEYYPTVHTHQGLDISRDGLNTVTDHVEFTTVGVRLPSLSQTTLLPVSPGLPRGKRPLDMRHKAILNHAYSNPQCNTSSGSLEKLGKRKRNCVSLNNEGLNDVIIVKRISSNVVMFDVSTQTEQSVAENKLCRQRSQPTVHVTKPVVVITRSSSWHQLGGQPAILQVNTRQLNSNRRKQPQPKQSQKAPPRRRRYGQSIAPNLCMLIGPDGCPVTEETPGECDVIVSSANVVRSPDSSELSQSSLLCEARHKRSATVSDSDVISVNSPYSGSVVEGVDDATRTSVVLTSQSQPIVYSHRRSRLRDSTCVVRGGRSKSMEEAPVSLQRSSVRSGLRQGIDNISFYGRARSDSDSVGVIKVTSALRPSHSDYDRLVRKGHSKDRSLSRDEGHVIMEEEDVHSEEERECVVESGQFDSNFEIVHTESEVSKL